MSACSVFLSYSTLDLERAAQLKRTLENQPQPKFDVFFAETSVKVGDGLAASVKAAIQKCDFFVVLWSVHSQTSVWVQQEIGHATSLKKPVIPIVLSEGLSLPAFISQLKYLPAYKSENEINDWVQKEFVESAKQMSARKLTLLIILVGLLIFVLLQMD